MEDRGSADDVDEDFNDSSIYGIKENNFAEEFPSELPSMASSLAPSDAHPYPSLRLTSGSKGYDNDGGSKILEHAPSGEPPFASLPSVLTSMFIDDYDHDLARGTACGAKRLEHAPPGEPMPSPGLRMVDSLGSPQVGFSSNRNVTPGAFLVASSRSTASTRTTLSLMRPDDTTRELTNEGFTQEDGVPNSAAPHISAQGSRRMAESGLYTVGAPWAPDGNDEGSVMVAEAQYVRKKWYQRPLFRWISLGSILFACSLVGAVVVMVVLFVGQPSAASSSSLTPLTTVPSIGAPATADLTAAPPLPAAPITGAPITTAPPTRSPIARAPPTSKPISLTPVEIACNFLSIPNVTKCRSTFEFGVLRGEATTGFTIPSEIRLLSQLRYLDFSGSALTSTIPSEIGLLAQLTVLGFWNNKLNSTIPSEIGLLTKLKALDFSVNLLISTIPSEIGLLTELAYLSFNSNELKGTIQSSLCSLPSLNSNIYIDCREITCASGCCLDSPFGGSSCG